MFYIITLTEAIGKAFLNYSFVTQLRPKEYYTIPKQTLEIFYKCLKFLVYTTQRVIFVDNVFISSAIRHPYLKLSKFTKH